MTFTHLLWDFNGTILDDVGIGIDCVNTLLSRRGKAILGSRAEYQRHFRFPIIDYYRSVGFDFGAEPFRVIADEWVTEYRRRMDTCTLCPHAAETIRYIKDELRIPQILFSASESRMLREQLDGLGLTGLFDEILGTDDVYAYGKTELGTAWVSRVRPKRALMIGDTLHDAECAQAMGIECVLVAQGHQSADTLRSAGVPVLNDLSALPELLRKNGAAPLEQNRKDDPV